MAELKKRILVVDDDPDLLEQMKIFLESKGYLTLTADGQHQAEELIGREQFDLALLDLMMEQQDSGFVLSHKIKKADPKKPVIILTAVTKETGIHFGADTKGDRSWIKADALLHKDVRYEQLAGEIERLLG